MQIVLFLVSDVEINQTETEKLKLNSLNTDIFKIVSYSVIVKFIFMNKISYENPYHSFNKSLKGEIKFQKFRRKSKNLGTKQ